MRAKQVGVPRGDFVRTKGTHALVAAVGSAATGADAHAATMTPERRAELRRLG